MKAFKDFMTTVACFLVFGVVGEAFASETVMSESDAEPWCSPTSDLCEYQGKGYSRDDLETLVPFAEVEVEESPTHFCQFESCFDNQGDFIGLNPFYWEYQD